MSKEQVSESKEVSEVAQRRSDGGTFSNNLMETPLMQRKTMEHDAIFGNAPVQLSVKEKVAQMGIDVKYNSSEPAKVGAHAFAQGNTIHLASGQEKHLPHEVGHVMQQREGRVKATTSVNGVKVNDDPRLEKEADHIGSRVLQLKRNDIGQIPRGSKIIQRVMSFGSNPEDLAIKKLAEGTSVGKKIVESNNIEFEVSKSTEWKALTESGTGIRIGEKDFTGIQDWGKDMSKQLAINGKGIKEFEVLVAHELVHLNHFLQEEDVYSIRGQRTENPNWDADFEEELTVKGKTEISKEKWDALIKEFISAKHGKNTVEYYQKEIDFYTPMKAKRSKVTENKNKKEHLEKLNGLIGKTPKGAIVSEDGNTYIFIDELNENSAREEKGFENRETYKDDSFKEK